MLMAYDSRDLAALIGLSCISIAVGLHHDIHTVLTTAQLAGRDLVANLMLAEKTVAGLAGPELFDWTGDLFLGITTFRYYPPGFFILTAVIGAVTGTGAAFRLLTAAIPVLIPLAGWYLVRPYGRRAAAMAGILALVPVYVYQPISVGYQTLGTGLVAQGLGLLLVLGTCGAFNRQQYGAAGLLCAATIVTHPFTGVTAVLYGCIYALHQRDTRACSAAVGGCLLTAWWWLPAIRSAWVFPTYTFPPANPGVLLALFLPLGLAAVLEDERWYPLAATTLVLLVIALVEVPVIDQELRFYTQALVLGSILAGAGAGNSIAELPRRRAAIIGLVIMAPALSMVGGGDIGQGWIGQDTSDGISTMHGYAPGRVLVATDNDSISTSFQFGAELVRQTDHSLINGLHVDSSPSAPYILSLEAWISDDPVYNPICARCNATPPPTIINERLQDLGVDYVTTPGHISPETARPTPTDWLHTVEDAPLATAIDPVRFNGTWAAWNDRNTALLTARALPGLVYGAPPNITAAGDGTVNVTASIQDEVLTVSHDGDRSQAVVAKVSWLPDHRSEAPLFIATFNRLGVLVPANKAITVNLDP